MALTSTSVWLCANACLACFSWKYSLVKKRAFSSMCTNSDTFIEDECSSESSSALYVRKTASSQMPHCLNARRTPLSSSMRSRKANVSEITANGTTRSDMKRVSLSATLPSGLYSTRATATLIRQCANSNRSSARSGLLWSCTNLPVFGSRSQLALTKMRSTSATDIVVLVPCRDTQLMSWQKLSHSSWSMEYAAVGSEPPSLSPQ
mmetsp:Transcript_18187/g.61851  ORF Transcript_18187/g.61851 Transcript_18187/m.61851 type:complete len:206 (-) Transcript_18187:189-806(-)